MRIIVSPAKKMNVDTDTLPYHGLPCLIGDAAILLDMLRGMSYPELKALWRCNDAIAAVNEARVRAMDLYRGLTPAILSYEGIQYQCMAPGVFEEKHFAYIGEHLRIISGLYGLLRPFDGVTPYRLEMQANLSVGDHKNLYAFWGDKLARQLSSETDFILNLASKEYSRAVSPHLPPSVRFLTCTFGEYSGSRVIEKGTLCKMARGQMVRWLAENAVTRADEVKQFDRMGYAYHNELSSEHHFVFIKGGTKHAASRYQST